MKKIKIFLLFVLLMLISFCFANKSFAETEITGANDYIDTIDIQSDGKILIGGSFTLYNNTTRKGILRLDSDGSIDKEFNPDININAVQDLLIQSDGKILLSVNDFIDDHLENMHSKMMRLNSDGSIDTSFNSGGGVNGVIAKLNIQSDGKILLGGFFVGPNNENCIARLNSDGSIDTSFNFEINNGMTCFPRIQSDGKIIVSWVDRDSFKNHVIRLNSDGSIDTTFNFEEIEDFMPFPHIQSDGKILLIGNVPIDGDSVIRINSDGSIDTSFNPGTIDNWIQTVDIQSNGKIILGGFFTLYNDVPKAGIVRLNIDGSIDTSFNPETLINVYKATHNLKIDSNNKILAVLRGGIVHDKHAYPIVSPIIRFNSDGSIDTSFSSAIAPTPTPEPPDPNQIDTILSNNLKGKLLLAVEDHGRIWYIDMNGKRHEVTWDNLMDLFTSLSLGITNENLDKMANGPNDDADKDGLSDTDEAVYGTDINNPNIDYTDQTSVAFMTVNYMRPQLIKKVFKNQF